MSSGTNGPEKTRKLPGIKVLIWDFDGTLYRPIPELFAAVREAEYRVIINHTGWPKAKAMAEFSKLHKRVIQSATEVVARLTGLTIAQAALEMEQYFDRRQYVKPDGRLVVLFARLKGYRHFTLANGVRARHEETLAVLGPPEETFELMVTSEVVGVTKPNESGFRFILDHTKLAPSAHLMIGDREAVDIAPAKKLGMKTCLVWSDRPSEIADVTLPTVYEIPSVLPSRSAP